MSTKEQIAFRAAAKRLVVKHVMAKTRAGREKLAFTILAACPAQGAGTVYVRVLDDQNNKVFLGSSTGYGFDKLAAALKGWEFKKGSRFNGVDLSGYLYGHNAYQTEVV